MMTKMNININKNEAKVLIASVDQNNSGNLSLDDFMHLLFSDSERFNVDLKMLISKYFNILLIFR